MFVTTRTTLTECTGADLDRKNVQDALKTDCRPLANALHAGFEDNIELTRSNPLDPVEHASLAAIRMIGFYMANPSGTLAYTAFFPGQEWGEAC